MSPLTRLSLSLLALVASRVHAVAIPAESSNKRMTERASYPFNQLVAFGDELSDNGNGSYAHGITGNSPSDNSNVYGFGTWTDGPVAVMFLADLLGVPLVDYAFGGCCGGGTFGAVLDNTYTSGAAPLNGGQVPSLVDQIHNNYTATGASNIKNAMQFIWIGENDVSKHTDAFWQGDSQNAAFASQYASRVTEQAEFLVSQGAPYVFVANIYPKNLAPVTKKYLCPDGSCVSAWGAIIQQANTALKESLASSPDASKFIYYDSFGFISNLLNNKNYFGMTSDASSICDSGSSSDWNSCVQGAHTWDGAKSHFWFDWIQPTTQVHWLIAEDMKNTINAHFGM